MVLKIYSVLTLDHAPLKYAKEIAEAFDVDNDEIEDLDTLKSEIITSVKFTTEFGEYSRPEESWFCFGKNGNFICTLSNVNEKDHKVIIPGKCEHPSLKNNKDKLIMLMQLSQYDINEEAKFIWNDLVLPQVWDICKDFGVSLNKEKDTLDRLKAKITKSAIFSKKFGKISMDKLEFKYHLNNPYLCRGTEVHNRIQKAHCTNSQDITDTVVSAEADKSQENGNNTVDENNTKTANLQTVEYTGTNTNTGSDNTNPGSDNDMTYSASGKEDQDVIEIEYKKLTGDQYMELLDVFHLVADPNDGWDSHWNTLHFSKYFLKHFKGCTAEELVVIWKKDKIVNVKSRDESCSLKKVKCIYPCVECSREVTDNPGATGEGLQCNRCNRYFHNQCMTNPVGKTLYNALTKSPDYIQIFCQECMNSKKIVEKMSTDMEAMKKEMTWAKKVSNGLAQNVEKAVVSIEKSTKTSTGLMKRLPTGIGGQPTEAMKKAREEKMGRTAVIVKPEMKTNSSSDIRKEFNKYFPDTALKAAIPTATGSVRLEFDSKTSRDEIISSWKDTMFGGNKGIKSPSLKPSIGIIKEVNTSASIEDITEEIQAVYPGTTVDFFRRNMRITGTVKLIFKNNETYMKAINDGGIRICNIKYLMEQFVFKPRVIRCFTCQTYGHISKNCRAKQAICGKCCMVGHESKDCTNTSIKAAVCYHCKGPHSTGSKDCSEFKRIEDKIKSINYGF